MERTIESTCASRGDPLVLFSPGLHRGRGVAVRLVPWITLDCTRLRVEKGPAMSVTEESFDLWIVLYSGLSVWNRDGVFRGMLPRGTLVRVPRSGRIFEGRRLGWSTGPTGLVGWMSGEGLAPCSARREPGEKEDDKRNKEEHEKNR